MRQLAMREPYDLIPEQLQLDVPGPVLLECKPASVIAVSVGLNDQLPLGPQEIDHEPADLRVHLGHWEAVTTAVAQKPTFKLAASRLGVDISTNVEAEHGCFADSPSKLWVRDNPAQVGNSASRDGHRNVLPSGRHLAHQGARTMQVDAGLPAAPTVASNGDIDRPRLGRQQPPKCCCRPMAEHRALTAGEHRRHPSALVAQACVPDRVNASVDPVQASGSKASADCGALDAGRCELADRHHTMLLGSDSSHNRVWRGAFLSHSETNAPLVPDSPSAGAQTEARTCPRQCQLCGPGRGRGSGRRRR